ncbi:hypothetical protein AOLI_G00021410 [Acnodon oligacanthus]
MPSVQDWINNPLGVVDGIFAQSGSGPEWEKKVVEYFKEKLKVNDAQSWVPSVNDVPLHYLKPNSLVKFRCMIQDMFDPEFFMGVYETVEESTNSKVIHSLATLLGPPNVDSHRNVESKRLETEAPSQNTSPSRCSSNLDLNFPLPGERGPACLVKVYEGWDGFKLNDMVEVFGILSVDPALSLMADDKEASSLLDPTESMETVEEQRAHSPPASLVPRIHMLYAQPLQHNNPLLPSAVSEDKGAFLSGVLSELTSVRSELLTYLTHIFLGDSLAAEYLILHLISSVYARRDVLPLGKFTLNVSGCPHSSPYTDQLYQIIQQLVPSSYRICMSLHNMNNQRMVPRKDYTANRLVSGTLQLASNTSLFLDETQLEQGQLDTTGVRNITALGNLISWQKVDYDFNYHQMEFPCNINVLIASEGRSLLPSDCQVHLRPTLSPPNLEEYLKTVQLAQASSQLNKYRVYLTVARSLDYNISDQITKVGFFASDLHQIPAKEVKKY